MNHRQTKKSWKLSEIVGVDAYPMVGFDGNVQYESFISIILEDIALNINLIK